VVTVRLVVVLPSNRTSDTIRTKSPPPLPTGQQRPTQHKPTRQTRGRSYSPSNGQPKKEQTENAPKLAKALYHQSIRNMVFYILYL